VAISHERKGRIICITINRPEAMNALDAETMQELGEALIDFRDDPDLWVAIITGAGERAFCAGADLTSLVPDIVDDASRREVTSPFGLEVWKPIIAAINGYCLAGGLALALFCDLRIAAQNARFSTMGAKRGILPGGGQTQRLPRLVPLAKALEMIFLADFVDAEEAYRIGLVNKVVPFSELMPAAWGWAEAICENAPLVIRAGKEAVIRGVGMSLKEGLRLEQSLSTPILKSEDIKEGIKAFAEKRKPLFKGR